MRKSKKQDETRKQSPARRRKASPDRSAPTRCVSLAIYTVTDDDDWLSLGVEFVSLQDAKRILEMMQ
ncbi:MAG: hypothetical protein J0H89_02950 [Rhizobiales bacterium]|nr:hypothetical protein [Hyphomicrobiales bacterium]